jgi:hypothetical protein
MPSVQALGPKKAFLKPTVNELRETYFSNPRYYVPTRKENAEPATRREMVLTTALAPFHEIATMHRSAE